jgi:hypothetical protein
MMSMAHEMMVGLSGKLNKLITIEIAWHVTQNVGGKYGAQQIFVE